MPRKKEVKTEQVEAGEAGFNALGLDERIVAALTALGYEEPTPVQRAAIPPLMEGRDMLALAATGTGKTAAFALPMLHEVDPRAAARERTIGLILVPTRELAMQVAEAVHRYGKSLGVIALPIYGGASMEGQIRALKRGVDVVVATPGRALDHIRRGTLITSTVRMVVLDEADEMLDMGFAEDLEAILDAVPTERQTALFSATLPNRIQSIARQQLNNPVSIKIEQEKIAEGTAARVRQVAYIVPRAHKMAALARVLDLEHPTSAIVFCRTRTEVDELTETLNARGLRAEALHGGLSQDQRDRVMQRFRARRADLLIATDVAARGLDVKHVSHVVNFDVPADAEAYVHRIGRTGRAGREGVAITLAEPREHRLLRNIEYQTSQNIEVATVPTVADLRSRRLELARATLREAVIEGNLDRFRPIIESLAEEFDIMDIAAAAVKLLEVRDSEDETEIPAVGSFERSSRSDRGSGKQRSSSRDSGKPSRPRSRGNENSTKLWIGAGRKAKIRPGDLVGAIANEAGVSVSTIGAIQIADGFSTVEVPEETADHIIKVMRNTTIKGRKVRIRRDKMR